MLQTQLCETYNTRLGGEEEGDSEQEEGEEGEEKTAPKMPVVSGQPKQASSFWLVEGSFEKADNKIFCFSNGVVFSMVSIK